ECPWRNGSTRAYDARGDGFHSRRPPSSRKSMRATNVRERSTIVLNRQWGPPIHGAMVAKLGTEVGTRRRECSQRAEATVERAVLTFLRPFRGRKGGGTHDLPRRETLGEVAQGRFGGDRGW